MEASAAPGIAGDSGQTADEAPAAPAYDVNEVHQLVTDAQTAYHAVFDGHVANEVERFDSYISTVRMIVDQSADMAPKETT